MKLMRRTKVSQQKKEAHHVICQLMIEKLKKNIIQEYDKKKLYNHFRKKNLIIIK